MERFSGAPRQWSTPSALRAALSALEAYCPDHVEVGRWHQAVEDGRRFLAQWGEQAEALGWTVDDLFGLAEPPAAPHWSYRRLSRIEATGLIGLLHSRPVTTLTRTTAVITTPSGGKLTFHRRAARVIRALITFLAGPGIN